MTNRKWQIDDANCDCCLMPQWCTASTCKLVEGLCFDLQWTLGPANTQVVCRQLGFKDNEKLSSLLHWYMQVFLPSKEIMRFSFINFNAMVVNQIYLNACRRIVSMEVLSHAYKDLTHAA